MPTPNDRGPHRPRTNIQYHVENGWAVPDQPADAAAPHLHAGAAPRRRRRARAKRRRLRQLALIGTACGILVVSGVITALLPAKGADAPLTSDAPANTRLVAPVPYAGSSGSAGTAQALNWGHRRPAEAGRRRRIHLHGAARRPRRAAGVWPRGHKLVCGCRLPRRFADRGLLRERIQH